MKTKVSSSELPTQTNSEESRQYKRVGLSLIANPVNKERSSLDHGAVFKRRHEASSIELFLDLFFVANLTVFTKEHEIKSGKELASYIGFFSVLWCTWLQIALYDVRFSADSVFWSGGIQRIQLDGEIRSYRIVDLVLMSSRFLLCIEYVVVVWYARQYPNTRNPLLALAIVHFASGTIFLGLIFAFPQNSTEGHAQVALYIVSAAEVVATLAISTFRKALSFKHTHLVERLGLLTLIIIGEGIIGMALSIAKVLDATLYISQFGGLVICGAMIIYFLYMLYFDQLQVDKFGTVRMHVWALLHFPLHVAYLLSVESIGQLIVWGTLNDQTDRLTQILKTALNPVPDTIPSLVNALNSTLISWANKFTDSSSARLNLTEALTELSHEHDINSTAAGSYIADVVIESLDFLFEKLEVEPPKAQQREIATATPDKRADDIINVFVTIFYYTFAAAGVALIMLSVLHWIGTRYKTKADYLSIIVKCSIGLGLGLLTTLGVPQGNGQLSDSFGNFYTSPWVLPTVALCFGFVLVVDNLICYFYYSRRGL